MPILEYAPPAPGSSTPLSSSRSANIPLAASKSSARPQATKRASLNAARTDNTRAAHPAAGQEDVSMELALSQETQARLSLRGGGGGVADDTEGPGERFEASQELNEDQGAEQTARAGDADLTSRRSSVQSEDLPPLHVEVRLKPTSTMRYDLIRRLMSQHLDAEYETLLTHSEVHDWRDVAVLAQNVDRVWIGECTLPTSAVPLDGISLHLHVYQPPSSSRLTEFSTSPHNDDDGDSDVPAASVLELPSLSLEGVWDTLIYDGDVKGKLLNYIYSTMLFSDALVDFNIVTWNRVVLLHGPPGTGKTSLCRALAQKLAIRLSDRYASGKLIEINSHSLFSKWFSESGKLVQRLFAQVTDMVDDESSFVVVLIDEVESLTAARAGAMSGKEPSDALRVVNALLTQLDKLKTRKNCLVMTTSNLTGAIDNAFIDRADIKQYIGLPPAAAVYWILRSCLKEVMRAGLIPPVTLHDYKVVEVLQTTGGASAPDADEEIRCSELLYSLAHQCQGLSGRTLRRLPVLAHARHIAVAYASSARPRLATWLEAMRKTVEEEGREMDKVEGGV
ncbi:thyroid receptor-interacting protein 13 [Rhodotorula diobovata]|uniref:Thyroid receptor-interacting protein 13 n=1 Tax=Rhodotorula diobovata TaxID=5288 RepID=A0A5C5FMG6_9BASI|nr:thyroid receptor-interacting protein 13 [Rhodotorula diobovata]